jgi:hypothetical protein
LTWNCRLTFVRDAGEQLLKMAFLPGLNTQLLAVVYFAEEFLDTNFAGFSLNNRHIAGPGKKENNSGNFYYARKWPCR